MLNISIDLDALHLLTELNNTLCMPEGPQMLLIKEQTNHFIGNKVLIASGDAPHIPFEKIRGEYLKDIKTFGKEIFFCFNHFTIRVHMMLFGKYAIDDKLNRVLRLGFEFENGSLNFYASDCRFITRSLDKLYDWRTDVLNEHFDKENALRKLIEVPNQLICEALLDQRIFAGVGNKIKNEVLYRTRVHPESIVGSIPSVVLEKLVNDCVIFSRQYLEWKIEGSEDEHWQVYKKSECIRDLSPVQKAKIGKSRRSSYFCDKCQYLYLPDAL